MFMDDECDDGFFVDAEFIIVLQQSRQRCGPTTEVVFLPDRVFFLQVLESANRLVDAECGIQVDGDDVGWRHRRNWLGRQLRREPTPANGKGQPHQPPDEIQGDSNHSSPFLATIQRTGKIFKVTPDRRPPEFVPFKDGRW